MIFLTKIFSRHFWCLTVLGLRFFRQEQKIPNHRPFSIQSEFPYIFFLLNLKKSKLLHLLCRLLLFSVTVVCSYIKKLRKFYSIRSVKYDLDGTRRFLVHIVEWFAVKCFSSEDLEAFF